MKVYEKFMQFAKRIAENNDVIAVYKELDKIFKNARMYREQAGLLEKIYNINKDFRLYEKIGDIYSEKLDNNYLAQIAYNNYFVEFAPDFCRKYTKAFDISIEEDSDDMDKSATLISDRYCCICYLLIYFYNRKEYQAILELKQYLNIIKKELLSYIEEKDLNSDNYLKDIVVMENFLSDKFVKIKHHNDINKFAIELNPKNEMAYINIIDDYIEYKNYDSAIEFYNNQYAKTFNLSHKESVADVCWYISDKHNEQEDFFNAVKRQQNAINLELGA